MPNVHDAAAYRKVTEAFHRNRRGATVADVAAATALPLTVVRETAPAVADEYGGRLEVTESGEIRYSFPNGFSSRYHGFKANLRRFGRKFFAGFKIAAVFLFKIWIMVMLLGYFVFFMLLALASLLLSFAGNSSSSSRSRNSGGGLYLASSIFNLIIRIWFYSELTKSMDGGYGYRSGPPRPKGKPLHKAIFSFVFGDGDPNSGWDEREKKAVLAYVQANRGVISLPEFMILTGKKPGEAEQAIMAYCGEFGGSPEVTEGGAIVYQFREMLLRADTADRSAGGSAPIKRTAVFSSNTKKMNTVFAVINGVNLLFGTYFFWNAVVTPLIRTTAELKAASPLYAYAYYFMYQANVPDPGALIGSVLGVVPLAFSVLFWLIPILRKLSLGRKNEEIKRENLRKAGFARIWDKIRGVRPADIEVRDADFMPKNLAAAREQVIKDMGTYSVPDVAAEGTDTVYNFDELGREKTETETYRAAVDLSAASLGKTVFDTEG